MTYDEWFKQKVNEALNSKAPLVPHEVVMERLRKILCQK